MRFREEVINVHLANLFREFGLESNPETIQKSGRPDVIINMGGLKIIIEGRFGNIDSLMNDIKERVLQGMADISMGIYYDSELRSADNVDVLITKLKTSSYGGAVCYFERGGLATKEFDNVTLSNIVEMLNNIFHLYIKNDIVRDYVKRVEDTIEKISNRASTEGLFFKSEVLIDRLKNTLGIEHESKNKKK